MSQQSLTGVVSNLNLLDGKFKIVFSGFQSPTEETIPTVDLTDDSGSAGQNKKGQVLPYRCDLCAAQYPNAAGLSKHRQVYHKTSSGMCELGVPLINMKQVRRLKKLKLPVSENVALSVLNHSVISQ